MLLWFKIKYLKQCYGNWKQRRGGTTYTQIRDNIEKSITY